MYLFFWLIGAFVYFKIGLDFAFYRDVSIVGALLLAIMFGLSLLATSYMYATNMGKHLARIRLNQDTQFYPLTLGVYAAAAAVNVVLGKMLVFGFSKNLNRELGNDLLFRFRYHTDETMVFALLIVAPITLHYILSMYGVHLKTVEMQQASTAD